MKKMATLVAIHEVYPSKEALDATMAAMEARMPDTVEQLGELLLTFVA